eukprot:scaffold75893_cov87-Cyclotella_meneghiniana.AAC.5
MKEQNYQSGKGIGGSNVIKADDGKGKGTSFAWLCAGLASRQKIIRLIDYDWQSSSVRRRMTTSD